MFVGKSDDYLKNMDAWKYLNKEIIQQGLCTQCGSCVGLSKGKLSFKERLTIPIPHLETEDRKLPEACMQACPAKECSYLDLNRFVFGKLPKNWLIGNLLKARIAFASSPKVRRNGASGGAITGVLLHLLETGKITGAVCLKLGAEVPYLAKPIIARTPEEIKACAQSVYSVSPMNTILGEIAANEGPLAYVGLPDQVASVRKLQLAGNSSVKSIKYIIGPYVGTQMYFESVRSFLRSHGVQSEDEIVDLKYRAGEWPGNLRIVLRDGRLIEAEKFYYNYLIPFYITQSSLQAVDFSNELTDISVGDAWSPKYESQKKGFSVVLSRSPLGEQIISEMIEKGSLQSEEISTQEALDMHGHMIDFKKRGSFLRNGRRATQPFYGYEPQNIPASRRLVERVLQLIFFAGSTRLARWTVEKIPLGIIGPCFNFLRISWKNLSKPTKRKGLESLLFKLHDQK